jgi:hypothetical protein
MNNSFWLDWLLVMEFRSPYFTQYYYQVHTWVKTYLNGEVVTIDGFHCLTNDCFGNSTVTLSTFSRETN